MSDVAARPPAAPYVDAAPSQSVQDKTEEKVERKDDAPHTAEPENDTSKDPPAVPVKPAEDLDSKPLTDDSERADSARLTTPGTGSNPGAENAVAPAATVLGGAKRKSFNGLMARLAKPKALRRPPGSPGSVGPSTVPTTSANPSAPAASPPAAAFASPKQTEPAPDAGLPQGNASGSDPVPKSHPDAENENMPGSSPQQDDELEPGHAQDSRPPSSRRRMPSALAIAAAETEADFAANRGRGRGRVGRGRAGRSAGAAAAAFGQGRGRGRGRGPADMKQSPSVSEGKQPVQPVNSGTSQEAAKPEGWGSTKVTPSTTKPPGAKEEDGKTRKSYVATKQREVWSPEEHARFIEAVERFGRKWKSVAEFVRTRTPVQIRSHAQKYYNKLSKEGCGADIPPPRRKKKSGSLNETASESLPPDSVAAKPPGMQAAGAGNTAEGQSFPGLAGTSTGMAGAEKVSSEQHDQQFRGHGISKPGMPLNGPVEGEEPMMQGSGSGSSHPSNGRIPMGGRRISAPMGGPGGIGSSYPMSMNSQDLTDVGSMGGAGGGPPGPHQGAPPGQSPARNDYKDSENMMMSTGSGGVPYGGRGPGMTGGMAGPPPDSWGGGSIDTRGGPQGMMDQVGPRGGPQGMMDPGGPRGGPQGMMDPGGPRGGSQGMMDMGGPRGGPQGMMDMGGPRGGPQGMMDMGGPRGGPQGMMDMGGPRGGPQGMMDPGGPRGGPQGMMDPGGPRGGQQGMMDPGGPHGGQQGMMDPGGPHGGQQGMMMPAQPMRQRMGMMGQMGMNEYNSSQPPHEDDEMMMGPQGGGYGGPRMLDNDGGWRYQRQEGMQNRFEQGPGGWNMNNSGGMDDLDQGMDMNMPLGRGNYMNNMGGYRGTDQMGNMGPAGGGGMGGQVGWQQQGGRGGGFYGDYEGGMGQMGPQGPYRRGGGYGGMNDMPVAQGGYGDGPPRGMGGGRNYRGGNMDGFEMDVQGGGMYNQQGPYRQMGGMGPRDEMGMGMQGYSSGMQGQRWQQQHMNSPMEQPDTSFGSSGDMIPPHGRNMYGMRGSMGSYTSMSNEQDYRGGSMGPPPPQGPADDMMPGGWGMGGSYGGGMMEGGMPPQKQMQRGQSPMVPPGSQQWGGGSGSNSGGMPPQDPGMGGGFGGMQ